MKKRKRVSKIKSKVGSEDSLEAVIISSIKRINRRAI